jgi:YidC/Oxa1 family membrane protein insertase
LNLNQRVLLALFLIAVVLVASNVFLAPPVVVDPGAGAGTDAEPRGGAATGEPEATRPAEQPARGEERLEMSVVRSSGVEEAVEETLLVETDLYRLGISSRGGRLISMELKTYPSSFDSGGVQLIAPHDSEFLSMRVTLEKDTLDLSALGFQASARRINATAAPRTLTLSHGIGTGDSLRIRYVFTPGEYIIGAELELPRPASSGDLLLQADLLPRLRPTEVDSLKNDINYFGTIMGGGDEDVESVDLGDLGGDEGETAYREGPFRWAGVRNKYFVAALLSRDPAMRGVISKGAEEESRIGLTALIPPTPGGRNFRFDLYIGPQDYYRLSSLGIGMEDMMEYGWWIIRPFTRMVVVILLWMHRFIGNYGVVIILFSLLTKIAFYPLTQKSMKSMQEVQKIQPLLKEVREKYKKDPQKMQQETMRLYREHKVNPAGGCLPMLVQMPVLWALFYVFRMTIEFRGADFTLWIHDLSVPDSPPVLPIVMGLSMFLQQKLSPQSADPKMAPMMYVMPVVLTIVFMSFPAGLVLYWTVNNILAIIQQALLQKKLGAPAPARGKASPRPA